jgi:hypothetical protein
MIVWEVGYSTGDIHNGTAWGCNGHDIGTMNCIYVVGRSYLPLGLMGLNRRD